jgi:hypothetical protein
LYTGTLYQLYFHNSRESDENVSRETAENKNLQGGTALQIVDIQLFHVKQSSSSAAVFDDGGVILADGRFLLPGKFLPCEDAYAKHQGSHEHAHPQPKLQNGAVEMAGVLCRLGLRLPGNGGAWDGGGPLGDGDNCIGLDGMPNHHRFAQKAEDLTLVDLPSAA